MPFMGQIDMWFELRGQRVAFDSDLAYCFQIESRTLKEAFKDNLNLFPEGSFFQLTENEMKELRDKYKTSNESDIKGLPADMRLEIEKLWPSKSKDLPYVFTETGENMLSNLLGQNDKFECVKDVTFASKIKSIREKIKYWERRIDWYNQGTNYVIALKDEYKFETVAKKGIGRLKEFLKEQNKRSFIWLTNSETELPKLYEKMLSGKFIRTETTLEQFKAIFTGQLINEITPIIWLKTPTELAYFIKKATEKGMVDGSIIYIKLKGCFVKPDGTRFLNSFKNLKVLSEKNEKAIDGLLI